MKNEHARAIAALLKEKGITNDPVEEAPNPFLAAREAFYVCQGHRSMRAWRELRDFLNGPSTPPVVYRRKLAEICLRALRHIDLPPALVEPVSYARGYFDALVKETDHLNGGSDE